MLQLRFISTFALMSSCLFVSNIWPGVWICACTHNTILLCLLILLTSNQSLLIHSQFEQTDALWLADECNNKWVNASDVARAKNQPFHMTHSGIDWQTQACLYWHTFVFWLSSSPSFSPLSGSVPFSLRIPHSISHFPSSLFNPSHFFISPCLWIVTSWNRSVST